MLRLSFIILIALFLNACGNTDSDKPAGPIPSVDQTPSSPPPPAFDTYHPYILSGDLDAIKEKGELRLLTREFDHLEHSGLSEQIFPSNVEQAEAFSHALKLKPVWIYAHSNEDLIRMLENGEGDIAVSNLTQMQSRKKRIDFSLAIDIVNEVLIHKNDVSWNLDDSTFTLGVKSNSSYLETAQKLQKTNANIKIIKLADGMPNLDLLNGIDNNDYDATLLDQNIAENLLNSWGGLALGDVVAKNQKISWGLRKNNPQLKRQLNQYLTSHSILSSRDKIQFRDFSAIQKNRKLRVITLNSPASYFMWRGEFKGFDYELIHAFAKKHNLRLQMIVRDSPEAMIASLMRGEGDVIAGSLTIEKSRAKDGLFFSNTYLNVKEQIIGAKDTAEFISIQDLNGKTVTVNPQSSFYQSLLKLQEQGIDVSINAVNGFNSAQLQAEVDAGKYKYTMADSHLASIESMYLDNIKILFTLDKTQHLAWGLRKEQTELRKNLNIFINSYYKSLYYNISFNKYFVQEGRIKNINKGRIPMRGTLSPYDELFKRYAKRYNYDWRMITAQSYQESKFNPKAKSYAGALGLMQVMPRTGRYMGYKHLYDPEENVAAAMKFTAWLGDRFPQNLPLEERVYFSLAAYNAGHGHVHDARSLARKLGKNPNKWFNNVEDAMLLLSQKKYYKNSRYGYVRGKEPVKYVREIRNRYIGYVKIRAL